MKQNVIEEALRSGSPECVMDFSMLAREVFRMQDERDKYEEANKEPQYVGMPKVWM